jgi:16S rRNA C967 or C1407 C5-methylase (RsmB/RsmF family)
MRRARARHPAPQPDLKWRQSPQAVEELRAKQAAILASAARLLKPGGRLVYATCSLLRPRNEDIAAAFTARTASSRHCRRPRRWSARASRRPASWCGRRPAAVAAPARHRRLLRRRVGAA